ncbi:hypothetical protein ACR73R_10270, partial [Bifidobacterium longum subsp. longum]
MDNAGFFVVHVYFAFATNVSAQDRHLGGRIHEVSQGAAVTGAGTLECISSSRCFVFSHVFFSGLGSCMHFPYFSGCAEVFLPNMRASL